MRRLKAKLAAIFGWRLYIIEECMIQIGLGRLVALSYAIRALPHIDKEEWRNVLKPDGGYF